jgi:hypothetical protein
MAVVIDSITLANPSKLLVQLSEGPLSVQLVVPFTQDLQQRLLRSMVDDVRLFLGRIDLQLPGKL